jgi:hypothetical protein
VPLLLLAGRGLRLLDDPAGLHPASEKRAGDLLVGRVVLLGLALLALPELPRYLAEHRTYRIRARVEQLSAPRSPPPSPTLVEELGESAVAASRWIPGDTRTLTASAAAALFARDGELALHRYSVALARGERAEVDLNLGRAYALLDRRPEALAAFVRSVWLTPALAGELPEAAKPLVDAEIRRREALLRSGAADAVPPLPRLDEP